ncbi:MAG: D-alanine--D-alanine ligase [Acidobacteriia bacterium]|nr:D-alanine--D-alanine ligase [Terriglobia bacterium]
MRVGIIFGGKSSEHEVSLASAASIIASIDQDKYEIVPIGITKTGRWVLGEGAKKLIPQKVIEAGRPILIPPDPQVKEILPMPVPSESRGGSTASLAHRPSRGPLESNAIDVVFPVLHGRFGEDGTIQGLLELAGIPYVGGGVLASAVGMDKDVMKRLFRDAGLPVPKFLVFRAEDLNSHRATSKRRIASMIRFPCFVKPANSGSSVGIHKAHSVRELDRALADALRYDEKVLVEEGIVGREIECSVLGNQSPLASVPGEVIPIHEFYDYEAKYIDEGSRLIIPAKLTKAQVKRIRGLAVAAYKALDCTGMARVDFFLEKPSDKVYVNEINTIPGFTKISMYPKLWEASGISYTELIDRLLQLAMERHKSRARLICSYERPEPTDPE